MTAEGRERSPASRAGRLLAILVFLIVWGLITHGTFAGSGDDPHYMVIAHSLAFDRDLDLANNYRDATLIGGGALQPESHAMWRGRMLRPVHDIGMPLVFAPFVRLAYPVAERAGAALPARVLEAARLNESLILRHQISLAMALVAALLARELFLFLVGTLGAPAGGAFVWSLLFAVTPPVLSHSFLFFTEIPTAFVTLVVFRRLMGGGPHTRWSAAVLGLLTGSLVLLHARSVGITAGLTLVAILSLRDSRSPAAMWSFGAGLATALAVRAATTWVLWGTWITTPHAAFGTAVDGTGMAVEMFTRATGLLFDREFGLFAYGPVYLLALPGFMLLAAEYVRSSRVAALAPRPGTRATNHVSRGTARGRARLAQALLIVIAAYLVPVLLPVTNVHGWTGGWAPAARFLVPVAPLLWIAVYAYAAAASQWRKTVVLGLVGIQVAIDAAVWQSPKVLWNDGDGISAFGWTGWLPTWTAPAAAPAFAVAIAVALVIGYVAARGVRSLAMTGAGTTAPAPSQSVRPSRQV